MQGQGSTTRPHLVALAGLSPAPRPPRPPTCAAPRNAHPEVKVSVQPEPRQHRWAQHVPHHSSMASSWSARSSNMLPMSSRMLPVLFSEAEGLGWAQCEKRGARWGRQKKAAPHPYIGHASHSNQQCMGGATLQGL